MANLSRVSADAEVCIGAGNCVAFAPDVFDLDDEGSVVVKQAAVAGDQAARAEEAADNCPSFAITLERVSDRPEA